MVGLYDVQGGVLVADDACSQLEPADACLPGRMVHTINSRFRLTKSQRLIIILVRLTGETCCKTNPFSGYVTKTVAVLFPDGGFGPRYVVNTRQDIEFQLALRDPKKYPLIQNVCDGSAT